MEGRKLSGYSSCLVGAHITSLFTLTNMGAQNTFLFLFVVKGALFFFFVLYKGGAQTCVFFYVGRSTFLHFFL